MRHFVVGVTGKTLLGAQKTLMEKKFNINTIEN